MSIGGYLLTNLAVDVPLSALAALGCGERSWPRVALAGAALASYSLFVPTGLHLPPLWHALAALPAGAIIAGKHAPRRGPIAAMLLLAGAMAVAGGAELARSTFGGRAAMCGAMAGLAAFAALLYQRRISRNRWHVSIRTESGGHVACFTALIDTGNRLREPVSGQPVLIAEERLVRSILPDRGYRTVGYSAIGGSGVMRCFRPGAIWIIDGRRCKRAPNAWIAIAPGTLPGPAHALAPGDFAIPGRR